MVASSARRGPPTAAIPYSRHPLQPPDLCVGLGPAFVRDKENLLPPCC